MSAQFRAQRRRSSQRLLTLDPPGTGEPPLSPPAEPRQHLTPYIHTPEHTHTHTHAARTLHQAVPAQVAAVLQVEFVFPPAGAPLPAACRPARQPATQPHTVQPRHGRHYRRRTTRPLPDVSRITCVFRRTDVFRLSDVFRVTDVFLVTGVFCTTRVCRVTAGGECRNRLGPWTVQQQRRRGRLEGTLGRSEPRRLGREPLYAQ